MNIEGIATQTSGTRPTRLGELLAERGGGAVELARVLAERCGAAGADVAIEVEELARRHRVYRVRGTAGGRTTSVIIKRLEPGAAQRNLLALQRWLPWLGLQPLGGTLLGAAASPGAEWIWQIYDDLGGVTLHDHRSDRERVTAAIEAIAALHTCASGHPVVAECRRDAHDLGMHFFANAVGDAAVLLDALAPATRAHADVRDRLRRRLERLLVDAPRRARLLHDAGGPDTMLHGDLWTTNILLHPDGPHGVRLVDWDRVGAGSFTYDLSILLYRFPPRDRVWMLDCYRAAVARAGWRLAPVADLAVLFETAECARCAYRISWPAIALLRDDGDWGFAALAEIDSWFAALEPATHV